MVCVCVWDFNRTYLYLSQFMDSLPTSWFSIAISNYQRVSSFFFSRSRGSFDPFSIGFSSSFHHCVMSSPDSKVMRSGRGESLWWGRGEEPSVMGLWWFMGKFAGNPHIDLMETQWNFLCVFFIFRSQFDSSYWLGKGLFDIEMDNQANPTLLPFWQFNMDSKLPQLIHLGISSKMDVNG